jgi:hypothetical protein
MEQTIDYQQLATALLQAQGVSHKAVGSTPNASYGHGPGGLFSSPALEQRVFSAMVLPINGLASILPIRATKTTDPLYGIFTGVTATTGSEATGVCDDPPYAGLSKLCTHTFPLGRLSRMTRIYDIDRVGKLTSRGEHQDFQFAGAPATGGTSYPFMPSIPGASGFANVANNEIAKALFEFGVTWARDFSPLIFTGSPTNNTAQGGYKEFYGLETLVNTGYRDAETGQACAAADSLILSFGDQNVSSASSTLINLLVYMVRNIRYIAQRTGLMPAKWTLVMPFSLFYEIVQVWPITYSTYRVAGNIPTGATQFVSADSVLAMRDAMMGDMNTLTGQYLLIDGEKVMVTIDDSIPETATGGGVFESEIYYIPLTVLGGTPVTFLEYFDYRGESISFANLMAPGSFDTSDNGRFMWHHKPPTNFCVQTLAKTEPRLLLLTPYIAGRITNVRYTPLLHERSAFTDNAYFVNGGRTDYVGYGPSYYSPTA